MGEEIRNSWITVKFTSSCSGSHKLCLAFVNGVEVFELPTSVSIFARAPVVVGSKGSVRMVRG